MACNHKFKEDLKIGYAQKWKPTTLIVGTFNPEWNDNNPAEWFYGRTENNYFWNVLPQVYGKETLLCKTKADWKRFCKVNKIAITDLIECISTADLVKHGKIISRFSDKSIEYNFNIKDLQLVKIADILKRFDSIRYVYFTRGASGLWKTLWKPIKEYCDSNTITCTELLTPSGYAFYQFTKVERAKFDTLADFIVDRWKNKWHPLQQDLYSKSID